MKCMAQYLQKRVAAVRSLDVAEIVGTYVHGSTSRRSGGNTQIALQRF